MAHIPSQPHHTTVDVADEMVLDEDDDIIEMIETTQETNDDMHQGSSQNMYNTQSSIVQPSSPPMFSQNAYPSSSSHPFCNPKGLRSCLQTVLVSLSYQALPWLDTVNF